MSSEILNRFRDIKEIIFLGTSSNSTCELLGPWAYFFKSVEKTQNTIIVQYVFTKYLLEKSYRHQQKFGSTGKPLGLRACVSQSIDRTRYAEQLSFNMPLQNNYQ